ncbi:hypothetical protein FHY55_08525 [Oceanicola sp. D3]|uniref:hypothetical protein n=1 Tax=Oceanicola sp. D3 TaxID=2587163 RepID=UPI00111FAA76|nr:hypothetical protein [Oceanicola sp. D3]QDC09282.1 hypothetical protein FHY55_08525 [Oceanicola sp. D3]
MTEMTDDEIDQRVESLLQATPADPATLSARVLSRLAAPPRPSRLARLTAPLPLAGGSLAALACALVLGYTLAPTGDDILTILALGGLTGGF